MFSRIGLAGILAVVSLAPLAGQGAPETTAALRISGAVSTPLTLTVADLRALPRTTLRVINAHEKKEESYEGVLLETLLQKAGAPHGEELRGQLMAGYAVAEAEDGYRVVFSLPELDSGFLDSEILVADTLNGAPLGAKLGPLRLVAPHDKRAARWIRMLRTVTVVLPAH